jgi:hypothetical protein
VPKAPGAIAELTLETERRWLSASCGQGCMSRELLQALSTAGNASVAAWLKNHPRA